MPRPETPHHTRRGTTHSPEERGAIARDVADPQADPRRDDVARVRREDWASSHHDEVTVIIYMAEL